MNSKECNDILKIILGKEKFMELLDYTVDCLDKILGENHSVLVGISVSNISNMLILYLGAYLTKSDNLKIFEKILNPNYKEYIAQKSIKEFYQVYKEYIESVRNYINKMRGKI